MLIANEFTFINVSIYVRIMIKALKLTPLPNCRSYSLNFLFWKFHTWSKLLASKLQTRTYSQELLSGEVQIMNVCLCLWRGRKLISLVVLFAEHYLGSGHRDSFLEFLLVSLWFVPRRCWSGWICSCGQGSLALKKFLHVPGSIFWIGVIY